MSSHAVLHRGRRAVAIRLGALGAATIAALGLMATAASAHHADVTASIECDSGRITYTATAWDGPTPASRTNGSIGVYFSLDGGSFTKLPDESSHRFGPGNGFSFTDSFTIDAPFPDTVTVRVWPQALWGDGSQPGNYRQVTIDVPPTCPPPSTTTSTSSTTTTTVAPTTTTGASTTTTGPATTTTSGTGTSSTTDAPPVTAGGVTSTTGPAVAGASSQSGGTGGAGSGSGSGGILPFTGGGDAMVLAWAGVAALAIGLGLRSWRVARRS